MLSKETSAFILVLIVDMVFTECNVGCHSCFGSTCTLCEESYFLTNGFCSPCPENCERCNRFDDCILCKPSNYGLHARCSFNCDGNCLNNACQDDTGDCNQCKTGFYGFVCQQNCSLCENERCDLRTCSNGCKAGYYEFKYGADTLCETCPSDCKHCTNGKTCYICNDGFYLYKFNDNVHCVSCFQGTQCPDCFIQGCNQCQIHNNSLVCADCPEGQAFNGETCVSHTLCSKECSTHCDSNGICQGECNEGWTGEKCSEQCNSKCLKCSKDNGNSCLLCQGNFYSTDCGLDCNPACIVISGKLTCKQADGYCLNGCKHTFWGDTCQKTCPSGCKDLICDRNNGTCTYGCKDGLAGEKCTHLTTIGKQETSMSATTESAESLTKQQTFARCEDKVNNFTIGYFSGFGSCVAIEVFAVLLYVMRRRYLASKTPQDNKPNVEIPTYYNTRTDFRAVNTESAEVSNNYESLSNNRTTDNVYNDLGTTLS